MRLNVSVVVGDGRKWKAEGPGSAADWFMIDTSQQIIGNNK